MSAGERTIGTTTIRAVEGDLTAQPVDAVVNAANDHLQHGGGVAAAIARAGGPDVQSDSDRWVADHGPLGDGQAAVTTAGRMPARIVIHVAGPIYQRGRADNEPRLRAAVRAALEAATDAGARTLAFPAISAGRYGYPADEATAVVADEVVRFLRALDPSLDEIRLVGFDAAMADGFRAGLDAATGGG